MKYRVVFEYAVEIEANDRDDAIDKAEYVVLAGEAFCADVFVTKLGDDIDG